MSTPSLTLTAEMPLDPALIRKIRSVPAVQQPTWQDAEAASKAVAELSAGPGIVPFHEVQDLKSVLARVAAGEAVVLQAGDCAESLEDSSLGRVAAKTTLLRMLADLMSASTGKEVVTVGRIAGQYAKPRSADFENVAGADLPVYRGPMVNAPETTSQARAADAQRILRAYSAAAEAYRNTRLLSGSLSNRVWTSHEALVLDYELPLIRVTENGTIYLSSTHWPWIGDKTRQLDHAHVHLAAEIDNPVAFKVGPSMDVEEVLAMCALLDPNRTPGRLTLISRQGAENTSARLPPLIRAVQRAGFPVIWLCDPMHANTYKTAGGIKTRNVNKIIQEVAAFRTSCEKSGVAAGGLHLEATPDHVSECVNAPDAESELDRAYTSLCDPRLNPAQAFAVLNEWK